jgi:hypothetical protein
MRTYASVVLLGLLFLAVTPYKNSSTSSTLTVQVEPSPDLQPHRGSGRRS